MRPGDRLVCGFVNPDDVRRQFANWPLHLTVVPWFRTGMESDELAELFTAELAYIKPFSVTVGEDAHFGYRKRKTVSLIREPTLLHDIEKRIRGVLHRNGAWIADETTKIKRPFQPHVTAQKSARLRPGDTFTCDKLYLIEQKGSHKEIANEAQLGL